MLPIVIIGAGPYGLSLAAHLRAQGVGFKIFGRTMAPWRLGMPPGMVLKSHAWSSSLSDPNGLLTVERYCARHGIDYHPSQTPLTVERFIAYGEAFQRQFAPEVAEKDLVRLEATTTGFRMMFDDGEQVEARRVVLAVGVHPFRRIADVVAGLPPSLVSHSGDYGPLDGLEGKRVVVLGGGASAIELAALLHERGVCVSLVARAPRLRFAPARTPPPTGWRAWARPTSGIGSGWPLWLMANAPAAFHALPDALRRHIVRNTLGPLGGPALRERLEDKVALHVGCDVERAVNHGDRVGLALRRRDGRRLAIEADQVIAATGYRIDFNRLGFLAPDLLRRLRLADGAPVLSQNYELSVPGLHVIGPASAHSFGPVARFVCGAHHPARRLAQYLSAAEVRASSRVLASRDPTLAESA